MKTRKHTSTPVSFIKIMLVGMALTISSINVSAQNPYASFVVGRDISGSGLGGNVCPAIALTYNKSTLSIGPNFQKRKMNLSGFQLNYRYSVAKSYNERLELFFSGNFIMQNSAYMSKSSEEIEESCNSEIKKNYDELRFKVIEGYVGIGLKVNVAKKLNAAFSSGIGGFNTLNKDYNKEMYRQKSALVMQVRLALIYNFKKW